MKISSEQLSKALGYGFADNSLLDQALTHRSVGGKHNERLEYLGDAILGFVTADVLFHRFPDADEGQLSRLRASLVKRDTLAAIAQELEISKYLRMGAGELRSGGHHRSSTLADAFEAILGAAYLDGGYDAARQMLINLFAGRYEKLDLQSVSKDPKTQLQEQMQAVKRPLPVYEILKISGDQHNQEFRVSCLLEDSEQKTEGKGSSRRRAEQDAAALMLKRIGNG